MKKITKKQVDDTEKKKKIPDNYVHTWEDVDQMINYDSKLKVGGEVLFLFLFFILFLFFKELLFVVVVVRK